jgi:hypothetical protein
LSRCGRCATCGGAPNRSVVDEPGASGGTGASMATTPSGRTTPSADSVARAWPISARPWSPPTNSPSRQRARDPRGLTALFSRLRRRRGVLAVARRGPPHFVGRSSLELVRSATRPCWSVGKEVRVLREIRNCHLAGALGGVRRPSAAQGSTNFRTSSSLGSWVFRIARSAAARWAKAEDMQFAASIGEPELSGARRALPRLSNRVEH